MKQPRQCVVTNCPNSNTTGSTFSSSKIKFYRFPSDMKLMNKWKERSGLKSNEQTKSARVCSDHFREKDFDRMIVPGKKILKEDAVPSINLNIAPRSEDDKMEISEDRESIAPLEDEAKFVDAQIEDKAKEDQVFNEDVLNQESNDKLSIADSICENLALMENKETMSREKIEEIVDILFRKYFDQLKRTKAANCQNEDNSVQVSSVKKTTVSISVQTDDFDKCLNGDHSMSTSCENVSQTSQKSDEIKNEPTQNDLKDVTKEKTLVTTETKTVENTNGNSSVNNEPGEEKETACKAETEEISPNSKRNQITIIINNKESSKPLKRQVSFDLASSKRKKTNDEVNAIEPKSPTVKQVVPNRLPSIDLKEDYSFRYNDLQNRPTGMYVPKEKYDTLLQKHENLMIDKRNSEKFNSQIIESMKKMLEKREKEYEYLKAFKDELEVELHKVEGGLQKMLTPNQIKLLFGSENILWTNKEMLMAFAIRYQSRKCYHFLRQKLNYPLPPIPNLGNWLSSITKEQCKRLITTVENSVQNNEVVPDEELFDKTVEEATQKPQRRESVLYQQDGAKDQNIIVLNSMQNFISDRFTNILDGVKEKRKENKEYMRIVQEVIRDEPQELNYTSNVVVVNEGENNPPTEPVGQYYITLPEQLNPTESPQSDNFIKEIIGQPFDGKNAIAVPNYEINETYSLDQNGINEIDFK